MRPDLKADLGISGRSRCCIGTAMHPMPPLPRIWHTAPRPALNDYGEEEMHATTVHPCDERLPAARLLTLGFQHVLVMYAGAVAVPLIVGSALKLPKEQIAFLIS